jgi:two-component system sensor histidine kinase ChvG
MDGPVPLDPQRAQRLASVLRKSSRRLDILVSRFLELARAEAGLPNEERRAVDLANLARGLIDGLAGSDRYRDVRLRSQLGLATVLGVPGRLESALLNLLDNAASFAGSGGWVAVRVTTEGRWAVVEVSDSGPGIAAADLTRVFDRFFTTRPGGHGTGLGLPLARALVEAHGGTLTVMSPPGVGATFTVQIPIASATGSHRPHSPALRECPWRDEVAP